MHVTVFFTKGNSLGVWANVGMLEREIALYKELQKRGIQVSFVTYGDQTDLEYIDKVHGIEILCNYLNLKPSHYETLIPLLHARSLWQTDVIKSNQIYGANVALRASRWWKKPLLARCGYLYSEFEGHRTGFDSKAFSQAINLEDAIFTNAKHCIVTTNDMATNILNRLPNIHEKLTVLPNYVVMEQFAPANRTKTTDIIFIGRLEAQKNVMGLLAALKTIDATATIIGTGSLQGQLFAEYGTLEGRVQWLGNIPNTQLPLYLNQAKIFILPSHYEGHPKTLIEAMSCGMAVIGARSPGIENIIIHGHNGWLCETDPNSISNAVKYLLDNKDVREALGIEARNFVKLNYDLALIAQKEYEIIQHMVKG